MTTVARPIGLPMPPSGKESDRIYLELEATRASLKRTAREIVGRLHPTSIAQQIPHGATRAIARVSELVSRNPRRASRVLGACAVLLALVVVWHKRRGRHDPDTGQRRSSGQGV